MTSLSLFIIRFFMGPFRFDIHLINQDEFASELRVFHIYCNQLVFKRLLISALKAYAKSILVKLVPPFYHIICQNIRNV